ncbi:DUF3108 domain-containing protein [Parabacteroides pacaensis]|uniref:DUF3108 domain-containing protein n=1 Tax=Parabacteroides pacaensis TaxID=2086575 RepID=UPI000D0E5E2E|nr:DUF3108 domain-containing protein [Parabacteroides pacaensis]
MKEDRLVLRLAACVCRADFKRSLSIILFFILVGKVTLYGQCELDNSTFSPGEKIYFDVYFKWGILMPKAGTAVMSIDDVSFQGKEAIRQKLTFRTTGLIEKAFSMRDTVNTYYTPKLLPLFYEKHALEDGYYVVDEMKFIYKDNKTYIPTKRYDRHRTKIDTTHIVDGCMFDILGVTMYLRSLSIDNIMIGDEFPASFAMGRDIVQIKYRYAGQSIVERGENLKYRTLKFDMDVYDEAVTQTKNAFEIWISDDKNRIPIKIRAKLKIGAAEAYFKKVTGNRYPLTSEVIIPTRR